MKPENKDEIFKKEEEEEKNEKISNEYQQENANIKSKENKEEKEKNSHDVKNANNNKTKEEITKKDDNSNNNNQMKKGKLTEDEENIEFEQYSRDKLITEFFLQKFIIWKSDVLILVIGNISLTEQKLLLRIKKEVKSLDKNKQIFVIHNLKNYSTDEQVDNYIENTLKKLNEIELEETTQQNILKDNKYESDKYFTNIILKKVKMFLTLFSLMNFQKELIFIIYQQSDIFKKKLKLLKQELNFLY